MKTRCKRILSVLLAFAVLVISSAFVAQGANFEKMSDDLQNTFKQMSAEEKTDVYLEIKPGIKYDGSYNLKLKKRVLEKMGLTSVPTWRNDPEGHRQFEALRDSMLMEDYNKNAVALLELLDVPEEDNLTQTGVNIFWHWRLTASQIDLASEQDCVDKMQTTEFEDSFPVYGEPETNDSLVKCIAKEYEITDLSEIDIDYRIQAEKGIITHFNINNNDFLVPISVLCVRCQKFTVWDNCYPEPMLYISEEDRLIELSAAFNLGYISNAEMEQLADNSQACVYYTGDIDDNKTLDVLDALAIQKYAVGKTDFSEKQKLIGDFSYDGKVDVLDAALIQRTVAEVAE